MSYRVVLWAFLVVCACAEPDAPSQSSAGSEELPPVGGEREARQPLQAEHLPDRPAPREESGTEPLRVSGDVERPVKVQGGAVDLRASGCPLRSVPLVILELTIDREGSVTAVGFLGREPSECVARYLQEVVGTWEFRPATLNGEPVAVYYNLTMRSHFR